jgi:hypothetical protein
MPEAAEQMMQRRPSGVRGSYKTDYAMMNIVNAAVAEKAAPNA